MAVKFLYISNDGIHLEVETFWHSKNSIKVSKVVKPTNKQTLS